MSDDAASAIVSIMDSQYVQNCCNFAAFTIYLYDQAITFGDQIDYIWRRRFSAVTALFALLHLSTISGYVLYIVLVHITKCQPYVSFLVVAASPRQSIVLITIQRALIADILYGLASLVQICTIGVIAALRVYAVTGRDWRVPSAIIGLTLMSFASDLYYSATLMTEPIPPPIDSCTVYPEKLNTYINVSIASSACSVLSEALVLFSTWRHTYGHKKAARESNQDVSVTYLLLRDGSIYFAMLFVLEVISAVGQYVSDLAGVPAFTAALETVVLSRFLLDLRRAALRLTISPGPRDNALSGTSDTVASLSELRFNSTILGSLGGSLALGSGDESEATESSDVGTEAVEGSELMDMAALESA